MGKIEQFIENRGGVASVSEMAALLEIDENVVRRWARDNGVRRLGSVFAFDCHAAATCAEDFDQVRRDAAEGDTKERRIVELEQALQELAMQHNELGRECRGFAADVNRLTTEVGGHVARLVAWERIVRAALRYVAVADDQFTPGTRLRELIDAVHALGADERP